MIPKIECNQKNNILRIKLSQKKSVDSDIKDNVVIDYDENGEITNIEIMEINLGEFLRQKPLNSLIKQKQIYHSA